MKLGAGRSGKSQLSFALLFMPKSGHVLTKDLKVMDATAISLMRENKIPIVVFSIHEEGSLADVLNGRGVFTIINGPGQEAI